MYKKLIPELGSIIKSFKQSMQSHLPDLKKK